MLEGVVRGVIGIAIITAIAVLFSRNRKSIPWGMVGKGLLIQLVFGALVIRGDALRELWQPLGWPKEAFLLVSKGFVKLLEFTLHGSEFLFGKLALSPPHADSFGFFFVFQVLPTIIFFSALMSVLYHLGIMQRVVQAMAWAMLKILRTSGAESLSNTANVFVGMVEAPLTIKPYMRDLTRSELLTVMVGGMATIAGGVMAAYVQMLSSAFAMRHGIPVPEAQVQFAAELLGASIMAAPGGLILSKILLPEDGIPVTLGRVSLPLEKTHANAIEAVAAGASDGLRIALQVAAMLLAFIALAALLNYILEIVGRIGGLNDALKPVFGKPLSMDLLLGLVMQYVAFGIGIPWAESFQAGSLIGTKIVLNEFVAYLDMSRMIAEGKLYSEKAIMMTTFALCGFANLGSVGMLIGGLTQMAKDRRSEIASLGMLALLGGLLTTLLTAAVAGIFVWIG